MKEEIELVLLKHTYTEGVTTGQGGLHTQEGRL